MFAEGLAARQRPIAQQRPRSAPTGVVVGGIVALLVLLVILRYVPVFDLASNHPGPPASVAQAVLESDPGGAAVGLVLVDRVGRDTTLTGDLTLEVREPDGAVWRAARTVDPKDFAPLPAGSLLAGRLGYRVVVPSAAWPRPPRRGGVAAVVVAVAPTGDPAFTSSFNVTFP